MDRNVFEMLPRCTFFYGVLHSAVSEKRGVVLSNGEAEYVVSSPDDEGLKFLSFSEKRLVVFFSGKIVAIYIRPRIKLIIRLGGDDAPSVEELKKYRPVYPKGCARLPKKK